MQSPDFLRRIPPVTRNIIIICLLIWVVCMFAPRFGNTLTSVLGLHFVKAPDFNPVQLITYLFMHDLHSITHILFNMFTLWMFGRVLEQVWGSKRYMVYYFVCGIGAALVQECVWGLTWQNEYLSGIARLNGLTLDSMRAAVEANPDYFAPGINSFCDQLLTVGASGAIFGLLLGFAFIFPNLPMYLFFIPVPIKAKYMVLGYAVLEFFLGMNGMQLSVAHFAHLGGMLFGLPILLYWKKKGTLGGNRFF
ncbi:MAG: rhomboid family intramembrane serine protease [Bacteroides sp.]|nr:rhomboid family intramembrane serine protease [Bacteroides sp.]MBD5281232.1 rhomboid family intramembrane serine protease [Bacteroides sp.]MBD5418674.1 rhomboid family intramembrane serine protease [Bacteroides sp.]MDE7462006.1 rhomboid family intramembrane serine protease [Muribaculaceae bacterium]